MPRIPFDTFSVKSPRGWADVTAHVEADDPPFTLERSDGVGALQFSVAIYKRGKKPKPTPRVLLEMVKKFARSRHFSAPSDIVTEAGPPTLAAASFVWGNDFVRVWQVFDGGNFAFVTYLCVAGNEELELPACKRIVRSIRFSPHSDRKAK